jgi:hypothetical protein
MNPWSKQCREEALRETQRRRLVEQTKASYSLPRGVGLSE